MLELSLRDYALALLTEESADDGSQFCQDYFWCIDPLDGTLPFIRGLPGYAVSISGTLRWRANHRSVYDPLRRRLWRPFG